MEYKLPRGIISHSISDSFYVFLKSLLYRSRDQSKVEEFELELSSRLNAKFCKSFGLARTAIYFILKYLNHPPGTKILLSPITIKGILDVVVYLGYEPVYLDIDDSTYVPSIESIEGLDSDIKVAIITPLYGVIPDIENISKSLKKKDIFSLLDFSHCFDAKFKNVQINNYFDASVYSSSSIKILDTLGGGHALTDIESLNNYLHECQQSSSAPSRINLIKKSWINLVRNLATQKFLFSLFTFPVIKGLTKYSGFSTLKMTGDRDKLRLENLPRNWFNQFSSFQAQIGLNELKKTIFNDRQRIMHARKIIRSVGKEYFASDNFQDNVYWQLIFQVKDSGHFQKYCLNKGVDVATSSLLLISDLEQYSGKKFLKNAKDLYISGCLIPCNYRMNSTDLEKICFVLNRYINENP